MAPNGNRNNNRRNSCQYRKRLKNTFNFCFAMRATFLVISMLIGVIVKQFGIGIASSISITDAMHSEMGNPSGQDMFQNLKMDAKELQEVMTSAFLWPLSIIVKKVLLMFLRVKKDLLGFYVYKFI